MPQVKRYPSAATYTTGPANTLPTTLPPSASFFAEGPKPGNPYPVEYVNHMQQHWSETLRQAQLGLLAGLLAFETVTLVGISLINAVNANTLVSTTIGTGINQVASVFGYGTDVAHHGPSISTADFSESAESWTGAFMCGRTSTAGQYYTHSWDTTVATVAGNIASLDTFDTRTSDAKEVFFRLFAGVGYISVQNPLATPAWSALPALPFPATHIRCCIHDGIEYVVIAQFGGANINWAVSLNRGASWSTTGVVAGASTLGFAYACPITGNFYFGTRGSHNDGTWRVNLKLASAHTTATTVLSTSGSNSRATGFGGLACVAGILFRVSVPAAAQPLNVFYSLDGGTTWGVMAVAPAGYFANATVVNAFGAGGRLWLGSPTSTACLRSRGVAANPFALII